MTHTDETRAACMAEIMANPGKPYEVVTRDGEIITASCHSIGGNYPIVAVRRHGDKKKTDLYTSSGSYFSHLKSERDIVGFAPKKPREWTVKAWVSSLGIDDPKFVETYSVPWIYSYQFGETAVPVTITFREGHDD